MLVNPQTDIFSKPSRRLRHAGEPDTLPDGEPQDRFTIIDERCERVRAAVSSTSIRKIERGDT